MEIWKKAKTRRKDNFFMEIKVNGLIITGQRYYFFKTGFMNCPKKR